MVMINPATISQTPPAFDQWSQYPQQPAAVPAQGWPQPPPATAPAYQGWPPHPETQPTPQAPQKPFPLVKRGDPGFTLRLVDRDEIKTRRDACLRTAINFDRVKTLEGRAMKYAQFPPIILFQSADGVLILTDGWNRLVVYDRLGVTLIPALIVDTSLEDALVAGLRMNIPKEGKLRSGSDAEHALNILATALGRTISVEEAASVGLAHTPNLPIDPGLHNSLCLPQLPGPQPKLVIERKPGKFGSKKPKPPRSA